MQVGNLDRRITFQQEVSSGKNAAGADVTSWVPFSPTIVRSASMKPLKGREVFESRADYGEEPVSFVVRYDSQVATITTDHRIVDNLTGVAYAIHSIQNWRGENKWLEIWTTTGTKDQQ